MEYNEMISQALNLCNAFVLDEKYSASFSTTNFHSTLNPEELLCGVTIYVHKNEWGKKKGTSIVLSINIDSYKDEADNLEQLNKFVEFINNKK